MSERERESLRSWKKKSNIKIKQYMSRIYIIHCLYVHASSGELHKAATSIYSSVGSSHFFSLVFSLNQNF